MNSPAEGLSSGEAKPPTNAGRSRETSAGTELRPLEVMRTRASALAGQRLDRIIDRHSHDIFRDQVRWMNRLKLELEEESGIKLTSNGIVQVALDLLIRDHELNGEASNLIQVMVYGKPLRVSRVRQPEKGEGS